MPNGLFASQSEGSPANPRTKPRDPCLAPKQPVWTALGETDLTYPFQTEPTGQNATMGGYQRAPPAGSPASHSPCLSVSCATAPQISRRLINAFSSHPPDPTTAFPHLAGYGRLEYTTLTSTARQGEVRNIFGRLRQGISAGSSGAKSADRHPAQGIAATPGWTRGPATGRAEPRRAEVRAASSAPAPTPRSTPCACTVHQSKPAPTVPPESDAVSR